MSKNSPPNDASQALEKNVPTTLGTSIQVSQAHLNITTGPIPSPETLAHYEKNFPGLAERIVVAFETEYRHRRDLADLSLQGDIEAMKLTHRDYRLGQVLGFVICMSAICAGSFLVFTGHDGAGGTIGGIGLASVIAAYYKGQTKDADPPRSNSN